MPVWMGVGVLIPLPVVVPAGFVVFEGVCPVTDMQMYCDQTVSHQYHIPLRNAKPYQGLQAQTLPPGTKKHVTVKRVNVSQFVVARARAVARSSPGAACPYTKTVVVVRM